MYRGFCGTDFFRGNRSAAADPETVRHGEAVTYDTCLFPGRQRVLPVLRSAGKDADGSDGTEYQHRDGDLWCTGGTVDHGVEEAER